MAVLMSVWDTEFRSAGLFDDRIYLASTTAVAAVATVAQWNLPTMTAATIDQALREMFEAELLYQSPVALQFRGQYGPDRQVRLNCWGRRLADRITQRRGVIRDHAESARTRIRAHLSVHRDVYDQHMTVLAHLQQQPPGAAWRSAEQLPVGVLC
ncbi:hypothetical protein [Nocardia sp. NPDC052566]|uniref:hypothetical protein n=1 Tax=Nocardia sp. NPDC052566 TaxID=3364330 RepID=UPI0037C99D6D